MSSSGGDATLSSASPASPGRDALHDQLEKVWGNPRGWRAFSVVNHSTVALRFMVQILWLEIRCRGAWRARNEDKGGGAHFVPARHALAP